MRYHLLALGLLGMLMATKPIASRTRFVPNRVASDAVAEANMLPTTARNDKSPAGLPPTVVSPLTGEAIQKAINAAKPGTTVVLSGIYACPNTIILRKGITIEGRTNTWLDGGTSNHVLLKINSCSGATIRNVGFKSMHTGSLYGEMLINEEGPVKNFTVDGCRFTCPVGDYNAISAQAWSGDAQKGTFHSNWTIKNCYGFKLNRMFLELTTHKWDGVPRFTNVTVTKNKVDNSGLGSSDGMAYSFSGDIDRVTLANNYGLNFRGYGVEFIGTRNFSASDNTFVSAKRFGGRQGQEYGSNGYNLTDGYNTQQGKPNLGARNGSISGGVINVSGRPVQVNYASGVRFTGGRWIGGNASLLQHGRALTFSNLNVKSGLNFCFYFDDTSNCTISGGTLSTEGAQDPYEWVGFYKGSTDNLVTGTTLLGKSLNGQSIKQEGGSNKWNNIRYKGSRLPDKN